LKEKGDHGTNSPTANLIVRFGYNKHLIYLYNQSKDESEKKKRLYMDVCSFPQSTIQFMKDSAQKSNPYSDFIETYLEKRPGFGIKKLDLWDQFIEYNKGKVPNITQVKFHKIISEVLGAAVKNPCLSEEYFTEINLPYPPKGRLQANSVYKDWYFSSNQTLNDQNGNTVGCVL
jgi:hypothetical protein